MRAKGQIAANKDGRPCGLAVTSGSACLVCGSTLTLPIRRGPDGILELVHCNHCGSEVPRHIRKHATPLRDRLIDALHSIVLESVSHTEENSVSGNVRLPAGYAKILEIASDALSSPNQ